MSAANVSGQRLVLHIDPNDCRRSFAEARWAIQAFRGRAQLFISIPKKDMVYMTEALKNEELFELPNVGLIYEVADTIDTPVTGSYFEFWEKDLKATQKGPLSELTGPALEGSMRHPVTKQQEGAEAPIVGPIVLSPRTELYPGDSSVVAVDYLLGVAYELGQADTGLAIIRKVVPDRLPWTQGRALVEKYSTEGTMLPLEPPIGAPQPEIESARFGPNGWEFLANHGYLMLRGSDTTWVPFQFVVNGSRGMDLLAWEDPSTTSTYYRQLGSGWIEDGGHLSVLQIPSNDGSDGRPRLASYKREGSVLRYQGGAPIPCSEPLANGQAPIFFFHGGQLLGDRSGTWLFDRRTNACIDLQQLLSRENGPVSWVYDARDTVAGVEVLYLQNELMRHSLLIRNTGRWEVARTTDVDSPVTSCAVFLENGKSIATFAETTRQVHLLTRH